MINLPNKLYCWLRGIWYTLETGKSFKGHEYHAQEEDVKALVTTAQCKDCGEWDISWKRI